MTLLQCISDLIENISVTDRQEDNIQSSLSNLEGHLKDKENNYMLAGPLQLVLTKEILFYGRWMM